MNDKEILEKLGALSLEHLEEISIRDILFYPVTDYDKRGGTFVGRMKLCLITLIRMIFRCNRASKAGSGANVFFLSESDARKDQYANFNRLFTAVNDDYVRIEYKKYTGLHIGYLKYYGYYRKWKKHISAAIQDRTAAAELAFYLLIGYISYREVLDRIKAFGVNVKLFTACNDSSPTGSLTVQMMNKAGLTTITLQHGVISSECNPWLLQGSHSTYYLAANRYLISEAEYIPHTCRIVETGMTYSITTEQKDISIKHIYKNLVVLIDGEYYHNDNITMLKFASECARKCGLKLIIRLHPTSEPCRSLYQKIVPDAEIIGIEEDLSTVIERTDIAMVRNSTVLFQTLQQYIPTFICCTDGLGECVYKNVSGSFKVSSCDEFAAVIGKLSSGQYNEELRAFRNSLYIEGASENYRKFYLDKH